MLLCAYIGQVPFGYHADMKPLDYDWLHTAVSIKGSVRHPRGEKEIQTLFLLAFVDDRFRDVVPGALRNKKGGMISKLQSQILLSLKEFCCCFVSHNTTSKH